MSPDCLSYAKMLRNEKFFACFLEQVFPDVLKGNPFSLALGYMREQGLPDFSVNSFWSSD